MIENLIIFFCTIWSLIIFIFSVLFLLIVLFRLFVNYFLCLWTWISGKTPD